MKLLNSKYLLFIYGTLCLLFLFLLYCFGLINNNSYILHDEAFVGLLGILVNMGGFFAIYRQIQISQTDSMAILIEKIYHSSTRVLTGQLEFKSVERLIIKNLRKSIIKDLEVKLDEIKVKTTHEMNNFNYLIIEYIKGSRGNDQYKSTLTIIIEEILRGSPYDLLNSPQHDELSELSKKLGISL